MASLDGELTRYYGEGIPIFEGLKTGYRVTAGFNEDFSFYSKNEETI